MEHGPIRSPRRRERTKLRGRARGEFQVNVTARALYSRVRSPAVRSMEDGRIRTGRVLGRVYAAHLYMVHQRAEEDRGCGWYTSWIHAVERTRGLHNPMP